ncbi:hypothetical protein AB4P95_20025 [Pseudomonas sp. A1437]|uniref:hypothetical protein n=1 Tax=unclassified Pseudomonas TaxID=196821 RepID=UPI0037838758
MAIPLLTPFPPPPLPTDAEAVFDTKAGASLTAQDNYVDEMNAGVIPGINAAVLSATTAAQTATEQAAIASGAGGAAAAQVALATAAANNAAASATAAESAPGSIGNLALLHAVALSF